MRAMPPNATRPDRTAARGSALTTAAAVAVATMSLSATPAWADRDPSDRDHWHKRGSRDVEIRVLSTRPFAVSGGDVLLEVKAPKHERGKDLVVRLNGRDVSAAFSKDAHGRLIGLVKGLDEGKNVVTVSRKDDHHGRDDFDKLELTNHPTTGQIFAPHQRPWICETEASGPRRSRRRTDPASAPTKYEWFYRTTAGTLQPLPT